MNHFPKYLSGLGLVVLFLTSLASCEKDYESIEPVENLQFNIEMVNDNQFGKILTNQNKQAIYFLANDVTRVSNCNGECADTWPPVIRDLAEITLSSQLNRDDFGTFIREDGQNQLTYKGWPLYYFAPNKDRVLEAPGAVLGDGKGGVFHVAKPDYTVLIGKQVVEEGQEAVAYLVNDRGLTLYLNTEDNSNKSNCTGGCVDVWPLFFRSTVVIPSSLKITDFGVFDREDHLGLQLSYLQYPIYYFTPDENEPGVVLGQAGGPNQSFFVVTPELQ